MTKCSSLILLIWDVCSGYQAISVLYLLGSAIPSSLYLTTQYLQPISDYQRYHSIRQSYNHSQQYQLSSYIPHSASPPLLISPADNMNQHFYILYSFVLYFNTEINPTIQL